jgi:hypothetical protein
MSDKKETQQDRYSAWITAQAAENSTSPFVKSSQQLNESCGCKCSTSDAKCKCGPNCKCKSASQK